MAVVVSILLSTSGAAEQATVQWQPTLENAKRLAAQTNRLVLVHFWADWCQPCGRMEREILSRPDVISQLQARYVPVKINADHFPTTCRQFGVTGLPADIIISPQGQVLGKLRLVATPAEYIAQLSRAAAAVTQPPADAYPRSPATMAAPRSPVATHPNVPGVANPPLGAVEDASRYTHPGYANRYPPLQPPAGRQVQSPPDTRTMPPYGQTSAPPSVSTKYPPYGTSPGLNGPTAPPPGRIPPSPATAGAYPSVPAPTSTAQPPAPNPPIGLEGYCPVELADNRQWKIGNRQWGALHEGRTYLFAGQSQRQKFMANPARYAPVISGDDLVTAIDQDRRVPGYRCHGVYFENQVYLFVNEVNLEKFAKNPIFYVNSTVRGGG